MKNPFNHPAWIDISLLLARLTLGAYMLIAGWNKLSADAGLSGFVQGGVLKMRPEWLPESFAAPYGYALPFVELLTGLMLILGLFTRIAAGIMTLVLLSIAIAVVSAFGIHSPPEKAAGSFHHSILMVPFAFLIAVVGSGRLALDPLYFGGAAGDEGGGKKK